MTRPGFRKGRSGGSRAKSSEGEGFLSHSLFSQAQILHLMKNEFARARRHGIPLGIVLIHVDRLAQLADLHGAELRGAVRQTVARVVREKTRGSDLMGATSDDRYLLVLPHTDHEHTRLVSERLHQVFQDVEVTVDNRPLHLSIQVGFTACDDQSTLFFDSLLAQVEAAVEFAQQNASDHAVSFGEVQLRQGAEDPGGAGAPGGRDG